MIDAIADQFVQDRIERDPELATRLGFEGYDDLWADHSMDGHVDRISHLRQTIAALHSASPVDDRENLAKEAMLERLGLEVELFEAHITTSRVSVVAGPAQVIRSTFDLMPKDTAAAWVNIASRLRTVTQPLRQIRQVLSVEAAEGNISAVRQIEATVDQIRSWTGEVGHDDFFDQLVAQIPPALPDSLRRDVATAADQAPCPGAVVSCCVRRPTQTPSSEATRWSKSSA